MRALSHSDVARVFNLAFVDYKVVMNGGHAEPLYVPGVRVAEIHYTQDHAASALHEAAHWCIAGQRRRRLKDYGYFYSPPPRTQVDSVRFEAAEVEAQASTFGGEAEQGGEEAVGGWCGGGGCVGRRGFARVSREGGRRSRDRHSLFRGLP